METFLDLTGIQWSGLGVIATFLVASIALLLPLCQEWRNNNSIVKLVEKELQDNLMKIDMANRNVKENFTLADGTKLKISKLSRQIAITGHLSLNHWSEFKYKVAIKRPNTYKKLQTTMKKIEGMLDARNNIAAPTSTKISQAIFLDYLKEISENSAKGNTLPNNF